MLGIVFLAGCGQQQLIKNQPLTPVIAPNVQQSASASETQQVQPAAESKNQSSFQSDGQGNFYGALVVTGYPVLISELEPFCEENCEKFSYVFFQVLNTDSKVLSDFLGGNEGNSFVGAKQLGIGCVKSKIITYFNDSDKLGMKEYKVSTELSKKILDSSKEKPVTIKLERLLFTGGSGAPACYSHFTYINSLE